MLQLFGKTYLTAKEASSRYGYSESWFYVRRHKKIDPPYVKIGGKLFYDKDVLDDWFKSRICHY